jgi:hypothetical protein
VIGRYDASYGLFLRGDGHGRFASVDMAASGVVIDGQVRHLGELRDGKGNRFVVAARNDTTLQILRETRGTQPAVAATRAGVGH